MVELPEYDGIVGSDGHTHPGHRAMVRALRAAMTHMGCTVDAYRTQHPHLNVHRDARHITRGRRRIDRFYFGDQMVDGVPGIICCEHIDQVELQVRGRCRKALSPPDHKAVRLGLRLYGYSLPFFWGTVPYTPIPGGVQPKPVALTVVVGAPLALPDVRPDAITSALVDEWHAKYVAALTDLFEEHKARYSAMGTSSMLTIK